VLPLSTGMSIKIGDIPVSLRLRNSRPSSSPVAATAVSRTCELSGRRRGLPVANSNWPFQLHGDELHP